MGDHRAEAGDSQVRESARGVRQRGIESLWVCSILVADAMFVEMLWYFRALTILQRMLMSVVMGCIPLSKNLHGFLADRIHIHLGLDGLYPDSNECLYYAIAF